MNWFNNLLNSASSFMGTPAGQNLVYPGSGSGGNTYASPTSNPTLTQSATTGTGIPSWLWIVIGGGVLLVVAFLVARD